MPQREHWDTVYTTKTDDQLSWFQPHPAMSLSLFDSLTPKPRRIIDIGGGQSALAAELLNRGCEVTVLDISSAALNRARTRLGAAADRVQWINADCLSTSHLGQFDLWHDRAVFHFLTNQADRSRYLAALSRTIPIGACAIIATFAPTGPEKCSGLSVCRYDAANLAHEFAPAFDLASSAAETHRTPWGKTQDFAYAVLKRVK